MIMIACNPMASLRCMRQRLFEATGVSVSRQLLVSAMKVAGFTKKKARLHGKPVRLEQDTISFVSMRDALIGRSFVSIDETSFGRNGIDVRGYSQKGVPLYVKRKLHAMKTVSVLAAVNGSNGSVQYRKREGSFDRTTFADALVEFAFPRGTVVLLDNVAFHHSKIVKERAASLGLELLFVPPYSPWFNPIEGVFSIVKRAYYAQQASIDDSFKRVEARHVYAFFSRSFSTRSSPALIEVKEANEFFHSNQI